MVKGPDEVELGVPMAQQGQAKQRRARQIESATSIPLQKFCNTPFPLVTRDSAPVLLFPGQFNLGVHLLQWFSGIFPAETRAQNRMASNDALPRTLKSRHIQRLG